MRRRSSKRCCRIRVQRSGTPALREEAPPVPPQPVRTLLYLPPFGSPLASVRGSVVLTRPAVYVQDSTGGGVEIQSDNATPLKIGDEVEVTGEVSLDKVSPVMRKARFRLLREAVPVSPMVLTANQVAEGQYDGMFVQVEGYLRTYLHAEDDGTLTMRLDGRSSVVSSHSARGPQPVTSAGSRARRAGFG